MATKLFVTYENGSRDVFRSWSAYSKLEGYKLAQAIRLQVDSDIPGNSSTHERYWDDKTQTYLWRKVR